MSTFSEFKLNPKIEDVEQGIKLFRQARPEVMLAIGGGSAIDMAKLVAYCGSQTESARECIVGSVAKAIAGPPTIAIPTTSGTGSEATQFAVVYVEQKKYSLSHPSLIPSVAIMDPCLTFSLPRSITAASGMDALCQGIESMWAVDASDESLKHAQQAVELANNYLVDAVRSGAPQARRAMSNAAYLAGQAINHTRTTAPHALSYSMTIHFGVPHGFAVALTLADFLEFNSQVDDSTCTDPRGPAAVQQRIQRIVSALGTDSVAAAQQRLWGIAAAVDCPIRLSQVGIRHSDIPMLASDVNLQRLANNPRKIDNSSLMQLLSDRF